MAQRHDEVSILEGVDLPRRELEVMGFGTGGGEVRGAHRVAADLSHRLGERVEGGDDRNPAAAAGGTVVVASTRPEHERPAHDEYRRPRTRFGRLVIMRMILIQYSLRCKPRTTTAATVENDA